METDPLKNLENVINANRKLASKLGSSAVNLGRRAVRYRWPERRFYTPPASEAQQELKKYRGRFIVAGGAGRPSEGLEEQNAQKIVESIGAEGILERVRAIGVCSVAPRVARFPIEQRENLMSNSSHVVDEINDLGTGVITRLIPQPVIIGPGDRPGTITQQAYGGLNRAIRSFEHTLDPETLHHEDELAVVAVISPFQARRMLKVGGEIEIGGIATLEEVGPQPEENKWLIRGSRGRALVPS